MPSTRTTRPLRRITTLVAAGVTFTLLPLPFGATVHANAPATAVTGLALGARGDAVKQLQQALLNQGVPVDGGVDGVFGPGTESALKQFQAKRGFSQTGTVDTATAIALGLVSNSVFGLTQGASGNKVVELQNTLIAAGHRPAGGADGIFGPATVTALKAFQKAKGLAQSGDVNAPTAAALAAVSGGAAAEPAAEPASQPSSSRGSVQGLKIGSRGDAVKQLQQGLMNLGFTVVGGADGIYGVLTANAVKSFQNANGLSTSGSVDKATAQAFTAATSGGNGGTDDGDDGDDHDPSASSPFVGLQYGSIGADVKGLQQALIDAGVTVYGGADGVYGTHTVTAVKEFQGKHGLSKTGKVDQDTANALASRNPSGGTDTASIVGLKSGALGNTVKQLQQAMIDAGVTVRGGADGIFGPATTEALKSFQTSQGLPATGVVDQATAEALKDPKAPSSPSTGSTDGYAVYGERGSRVVDLQNALLAAGISFVGGADGAFGSATAGAIMSFQRANGLSVTGKLDDATAKALGLTAAPKPTTPDPATVKLDAFPVQGPCGFGDSYGYPRSGGRTHEGIDIIASEGNELYAVADGKVTKVYSDYPGSLAGNGIRLTRSDGSGTYYFYAHMSELADGIELGVPVKAGQLVGYIGNTGNSGTPHLHFEAHPNGGAAVNPYQALKAIDGCSITASRG
ncbi:putative peptidoglycan binding protein [Ilumatobacter fluminis]|uniref:Putative peptidoglycan binding protein n=1 Tax=Ilumatobacter fluminis TaxID=467091 RepID=A0A4V3EJ06_9ACTN|nr:peptidoglycan-binding protein [Ilumatobacter fluminis]TDT16458.1 putative peptidoglycan binding protein [Ilumatobacter fluminis]